MTINRLCPPQGHRRGVALVMVIVAMGLLGAMCQALTMLVAIQHRKSFEGIDRAQVHRLAEAGLLRAQRRLADDANWTGETWTPPLAGELTGRVAIRVAEAAASTPSQRSSGAAVRRIHCEAELTTGRQRTIKSVQTLELAPAG